MCKKLTTWFAVNPSTSLDERTTAHSVVEQISILGETSIEALILDSLLAVVMCELQNLTEFFEVKYVN